jgi:hypothetical protein
LWVPYGFIGFLCELAELLLCIHPVYLGASYAFLMKFSYLSKKKKLIKKKYIYIYISIFIPLCISACKKVGGYGGFTCVGVCACTFIYLSISRKCEKVV